MGPALFRRYLPEVTLPRMRAALFSEDAQVDPCATITVPIGQWREPTKILHDREEINERQP